MSINFVVSFIFLGITIILLIISVLLTIKFNKYKRCTTKISGEVCGYTNSTYNGLSMPIVKYVIDKREFYTILRYNKVYVSSNNEEKSIMNSNIDDTNLSITVGKSFTNPFEDICPVGTKLDVYYEENNPKNSFVIRKIKPRYIKFMYIFTLIVFIISILSIFLVKEVN